MLQCKYLVRNASKVWASEWKVNFASYKLLKRLSSSELFKAFERNLVDKVWMCAQTLMILTGAGWSWPWPCPCPLDPLTWITLTIWCSCGCGAEDQPPDECPPSTLMIFTIFAGAEDLDQPELLEPLEPPKNVADAVHTQRAITTNTYVHWQKLNNN